MFTATQFTGFELLQHRSILEQNKMKFTVLIVALVTCSEVHGKGLKVNPLTEGMQLTPVILIPGKGGSQLEARYSHGYPTNSSCQHHHRGWYRLWMDVWQLFPG